MPRRFTIPAVIVAATLAGGCADDMQGSKADRPAGQSGSPSTEAAPTSDPAGPLAGGKKTRGGEKASGGRKTGGDGKERATEEKRSTGGRRPTARQIRAARENQTEQQVDDLSPRLRRIRERAIASQLNPQKPLKLSPEEQRAFDIGKHNPQYQSIP